MKTRNGFVSNSSSSSFIVGFKEKPKTVEEMKKLLYGDEDFHALFDDEISTNTLAERVFNDIRDQEPMSKEVMIERLTQFCNSETDCEKFRLDNGKIDWKAYFAQRDMDNRKAAQDIFGWFMSHPGLLYFLFEYKDHDPVSSNLEHGGTFHNLVHRRFSHH